MQTLIIATLTNAQTLLYIKSNSDVPMSLYSTRGQYSDMQYSLLLAVHKRSGLASAPPKGQIGKQQQGSDKQAATHTVNCPDPWLTTLMVKGRYIGPLAAPVSSVYTQL